MRYFIAGAAGFLGYHLSKTLLQWGNEVVGFDNLSTGTMTNIDELMKYEKFKFHSGDVRNIHDVERVKNEHKHFDYVFNLACPASPKDYQFAPLSTMHTNFNGTKNLLITFGRGATFIQASTSEIYGDPLVEPQNELYRGNVNTVGPRACYDEGKRIAETMVYEHWHLGLLDYPPRIMRIFNTYGPHMDPNDGRVISNFINQAINDHEITVYGDGEQTRSFCYVRDLIRAFVTISEIETDDLFVANAGNPETYTINEIAEKVIEMTHSNSNIAYYDLPQDDPLSRVPDISKMAMHGWRPEVPLERGLGLTIDYFRSLY